VEIASAPAAAASPLRVAFVGQSVYFEQCALEEPCEGVEPFFIDFRAAAAAEPLIDALSELDPDVVLVFRPEIVPPRLFGSLRATTIGYLTEPLPRPNGNDHPDLRARLQALKEVDPGNFDRIVSFDPLIAQTAGAVLPVWRSLPLPVADSLFMDLHGRSDPPALLFVGRSTEHRERMLDPIKRAHSIAHIGHGLFGAPLRRILAACDVQLNLHNNAYPTFENRVSIALAAGHLVISEPLSPRHELRPGVDYLEVETPQQLLRIVDELASNGAAHAPVQAEGRLQAERFRASRVYPTMLRDALEDVRLSGGRR
jgi:hypothetical protein